LAISNPIVTTASIVSLQLLDQLKAGRSLESRPQHQKPTLRSSNDTPAYCLVETFPACADKIMQNSHALTLTPGSRPTVRMSGLFPL